MKQTGNNTVLLYSSQPLAFPWYADDEWDLRVHPRFDLSKEPSLAKKRSFVISFGAFGDTPIKSELKAYFIHLIDEKKLPFERILVYHNMFKAFAEYLSSSNFLFSSILDRSIEEITLGYRTWRSEHGLCITAIQHHALSETLEPVIYEYDSTPIQQVKSFWTYTFEQRQETVPEYEKDVWDVRNLPIKVEICEARPRYKIRFDGIHQEFFKEMCKQYIYHRLQTKAFETSYVQMFALRNLSDFLAIDHSDIQSFNELSRVDIEHFFDYMGTLGLPDERVKTRIGSIKQFFDESLLLGIPGSPTKSLITLADTHRKHKTLPKFFSDNELASLNAHISDLPLRIARMFFVLQSVGMRVSEACILKDDCLKKSPQGDFILSYYQIKTKKWNTIPINEIVASTIRAAMQTSKNDFGDDCVYVFAQDHDHPISPDMFSHHMNQMSYKFGLTDDVGKPLRIKSHTFRGTVATRYANLGIDMNVIKLMLGQKYVGVLKHYVTIHEATMIECLREITEEDNRYIENIGHIEDVRKDEEQNEAWTPLSVGFCSHPISAGRCPHSNSCYTCRMFRPSLAHMALYKRQLQEAERNMSIAKLNGYERIYEANSELFQSLTSIVQKIEEVS